SYTFGVDPLQQYLIEFPGGRLQALGIAWDSRPVDQGGQRWYHLYPDEQITHDDPLHWTGTYQNWNHMCAECHSTNLRKNYRVEDDRFETSWTDIDVSCEACHGPGSEHVRLTRTLEEGEAYPEEFLGSVSVRLRADDLGVWTIDPETGNASRDAPLTQPFVDVCAPCHSRRSSLDQHIIAGRPFLDTHRPALLEEGLYHPDGQILDEVYVYGSFIQSKMHAAGVTCANCHDSHGLQLLAEGNALCAQCHLASKFDSPEHHFHKPDSVGALCVSCHMPTKTYMGVDMRRDHSMRSPRPDLTMKVGAPNACTACHSDKPVEWSAQYAEEWYGPVDGDHFGETLAAARAGDPRSFDPLLAMTADSTLPAIVRATAVELAGGFPRSAVASVLARSMQDPDPLVRMASARASSSRSPLERTRIVLPLLRDSIRAVRSEAVQVLATTAPIDIPPRDTQAYEEALNEYRASLELHADRPETHVSLALIDVTAGRHDEAERRLRTAIRLDSQFAAAYVNLADLLRMQGRDAAGEALLMRGLRVAPQAASLHYSLGLLMVRLNRHEEASTELKKAAELAPEQPRFVYAY
ncbi:MAG: tetratricopeptide repeat protein, partial [Rhodothermales bacterium]|nr:tetratricopeptide repeat protein [Rhodothermales bacterium]